MVSLLTQMFHSFTYRPGFIKRGTDEIIVSHLTEITSESITDLQFFVLVKFSLLDVWWHNSTFLWKFNAKVLRYFFCPLSEFRLRPGFFVLDGGPRLRPRTWTKGLDQRPGSRTWTKVLDQESWNLGIDLDRESWWNLRILDVVL